MTHHFQDYVVHLILIHATFIQNLPNISKKRILILTIRSDF